MSSARATQWRIECSGCASAKVQQVTARMWTNMSANGVVYQLAREGPSACPECTARFHTSSVSPGCAPRLRTAVETTQCGRLRDESSRAWPQVGGFGANFGGLRTTAFIAGSTPIPLEPRPSALRAAGQNCGIIVKKSKVVPSSGFGVISGRRPPNSANVGPNLICQALG